MDAGLQDLIRRIGASHVEQRLAVETEHEAQLFGQGTIFFNLENSEIAPYLIEMALRSIGLYRRARDNAARLEVRHNTFQPPALPAGFDGFKILHLSDLHADISEAAMHELLERVDGLVYDICVLTGDYRGRTFGPFEKSLTYLRALCARLKPPLYGVLGNHDSIRMAPPMEAMGIRMLFNECEAIARGEDRIQLAGIDDAHFYRADDIDKVAALVPAGAFSILLSHTPETYRQAAQAGFDVMLSGHTHGGQLCLPGGFPIKLEARLPRSMGAGAWQFKALCGYTSVGAGTSLLPVRLNCPPEITLHSLKRLPSSR